MIHQYSILEWLSSYIEMVGCENENTFAVYCHIPAKLQGPSQAVVRNPSAVKAPELFMWTHCGAYNRGGAVYEGDDLAGYLTDAPLFESSSGHPCHNLTETFVNIVVGAARPTHQMRAVLSLSTATIGQES